MASGRLKTMFDPQSVALIGASETAGSVGRALLENLLLFKDRKLFPVNPKRETVLDVKCYPAISRIRQPVDLAVVATPAATVPAMVEECGQAGVEGLHIISAGFKETGAAGRKLEEEISRIREKYNMRIVGPNCIGVIRPKINLNTSFLKVNPKPGNIAFISQSGALGSAILDWAVNAHIGFSLFASLGSMIDVDFGDLIDFLGEDDQTRSIMLYMEGIGHARKFMSAARGFARNKPIIVIKPGRFSESAQAALSHTGAMAGDDRVYDAAFRRAGVIRVKEFADLFNTAEVLDAKHLPINRRLAIITNAGGFGVMAVDALIEQGGELAGLSEKSIQELDAFLPGYWSKRNPVDILGDGDKDRYIKAIQVCLNDPQVDGILVIYAPQTVLDPEALAEAVKEIAKKSWKPFIAAWIGGQSVQKGREILARNNIPTYDNPEDAVKTYLYMYKYHRNLTLLYETPSELAVSGGPPKNHLKAFIRRVIREGRTLLTEDEAKNFLHNYAIPVTVPSQAHDVEDAVQIAQSLGYPVVLKIVSPDITHKSDLGGIQLGVMNDEHLRKSYEQILADVKRHAPEAKITGISVQKMIEKIDYELILGSKKDRDFGSVILFGMGGIETEVFKDVSIGFPPLNQTLARRLMEETKIFKMLQGFRGRKPADMKQLEHLLVSFSNLIVDFPEIVEMDINPVAVAQGRVYALDARIILEKEYREDANPYPHLVITPYPMRYTTIWKLKDGTEITLRPIRPEDEPLEHVLLSNLSEKTMRQRFFSLIKDISHEMLVRFCNIDYDREMAIVAELKEGDRKKIIGIGRIISEADHRSAEYAVLVDDQHQGKGLGYKLMDVLIGIGQEKGLDEIYGLVLSENDQMLAVVRKLGFKAKRQSDGITRVVLSLK